MFSILLKVKQQETAKSLFLLTPDESELQIFGRNHQKSLLFKIENPLYLFRGSFS